MTFWSSVSRLWSVSTRGNVPNQRKGGTTSGASGPLGPLKRKRSPPRLTNAWSVKSVRISTRTARSDSTSNVSWRSGRARSSSYRAVSTEARSNRSVLTASRKKADFRAFASTIVKETIGDDSLRGMAGDPPPEPISMREASAGGRCRAAIIGSRSNRSMASSGLSNAVRFIFLFQRESSS